VGSDICDGSEVGGGGWVEVGGGGGIGVTDVTGGGAIVVRIGMVGRMPVAVG
jgi:hypothetical protein